MSESDIKTPEDYSGRLHEAAVGIVLGELKQLWLSGKSLFEVLDALYESLYPIIPFDRLSVAFHNEETGLVTVRWVRSRSPVTTIDKGYWAVLKGSSLEPILRTGRPRIISDFEKYVAEHPESRSGRDALRDGIRSNLTCPLRAGARPIGLLFFSSCRPDAYSPAHIDTFLAVAESLTLAVEKVKYIDDLEQAKRNYAQILYFVAHELKAPLSSAVTLGQTLLAGYLGTMPRQQAEAVERMVANSNFLISLVRDYLDLSQIETGEMAFHPEPVVDLAEQVVRPVVEMQSPQAMMRQMTIETDLEYLTAPCDPALIRVVLGNLLANAVKYGRAGSRVSVRLVRRAFADYTETGDRKRDWWALFVVRNDGPGFTAEQKQRLFARFQRLRHPEHKGVTGSGLGLYISRQIVLRHGGETTAESEPGSWAEFSFRIPLRQDAPLTPSGRRPAADHFAA
jgi:signal transduction histidine kinase